ncbi:MAG: putative adhesin [Candidatus Rhabdochlamydia sp.]
MLAGTNVPGHIRNYTLSKYQKFGIGGESYLDIMQIVNRSRNMLPIVDDIGLKPVDILTIRNRFGRFDPNLEDVFKSLQNHEIQYKKNHFGILSLEVI